MKLSLLTFSLLVLLASCASWNETSILTASNKASSAEFGKSVSIHGNTIVVGARYAEVSGIAKAGSAYVLKRDGSSWSEKAILTASNKAVSAFFGYSVSNYDDVVVVGAYGAKPTGLIYSGSAYVFRYNGTGWPQEAVLNAPVPTQADYFGSSVSVYKNTAIIGAYGATGSGVADAGCVFVFNYGGTGWSQKAILAASNAAADATFGYSVSISGNILAVGAKEAGTAYVFMYYGSGWLERKILKPQTSTYFGASVSVHEKTIVVGDDYDAGKAYVYWRFDETWVEAAMLTASNAQTGAKFGNSVSVYGNVVVVGAYYTTVDNLSRSGSVYAYKFSQDSWSEEILIASNNTAMSYFGNSVSIYGPNAVVGSYNSEPSGLTGAGSAYVFYNPDVGIRSSLSQAVSARPALDDTCSCCS
jgi:hypothetical protein